MKNVAPLTTLLAVFVSLIRANIDQSLAICLGDEFDTAVATRDNQTYIFKGRWYWTLNSEMTQVRGNFAVIANDWPGLPNDIDMAFTVQGDGNRLKGKTIFIKNNHWYQFDNRNFEASGEISKWQDFSHDFDFAATQHRDPIVVFYRQDAFRGTAYYFDSAEFPEKKMFRASSHLFGLNNIKAVVPFGEDRFLVFLLDGHVGEHCIVAGNRRCTNIRQNFELFECPEETRNIFDRNYMARMWRFSGLRFYQFSVVLLTVLIMGLFLQTFIIVVLSLKLWMDVEDMKSET